MTSFEDVLARDGKLVYKIRGVSMRPLLRQDRDLVVIRPPASRLEKNDVALYRRGEKYVLHRVIEVTDDGYLIRGDNTFSPERVPDAAVIGVMTGFNRGGREHDTAERTYRAYVRLWNGIYPVRRSVFRLKKALRTAAGKLGLLPLLKKLLRRG